LGNLLISFKGERADLHSQDNQIMYFNFKQFH
jgi:hypothetical protein